MEALSFLRFWKQTSNVNKEIKSSVFNVNSNKDLDESDDSLFELQLSLPTSNNNNTQSCVTTPKHHGGDPAVSLSKRKIIPVEPTANSNLNTKPQPPVSLFKSSPKFSLFPSSKNSKSKNPEVKPSEGVIPGPPTLTRVTSIGKTTGSTFHKLNSIDDLSTGEPSKRFSKDAIQKYVKKLNPMQGTKTLRKDNVNPSPTGSPAPVTSLRIEKQGNVSAGIRVARKHLGKTRSGSDGPSPAVSRGRDGSLIMQDDGIQSAILHCKRSFNSSPGL